MKKIWVKGTWSTENPWIDPIMGYIEYEKIYKEGNLVLKQSLYNTFTYFKVNEKGLDEITKLEYINLRRMNRSKLAKLL